MQALRRRYQPTVTGSEQVLPPGKQIFQVVKPPPFSPVKSS